MNARCLFSSAVASLFFLEVVASMAATEINPPILPTEDKITALVGARLIDGHGGTPVENSVVLIRGAKIVSVGAAGDVDIPESAQLVDVSGMSLLPGLIDSHFHSRYSTDMLLDYELKNGITSFRDPGHPFRFYETVREYDGVLPRVFLCGAHLDGPPPVWPDQAIVIENEAHARRTVREHVGSGASAIKVYFRLPLNHVQAACAAAAERDVLVTAHLELVDAEAAIRAGVRGIEHVTSFGTSLADQEHVARFKSEITADSGARRQLRHWLWSTLDLENSERLKPLIDLIIERDVFVSPTLAIFERREGEKDGTEEQARAFANMLKFVGMCHESGAKIVVGSHTAAPFAENGKAYQRELELLVTAGLTPLEAITAGTLHNAKFFDIDDRLGSVEPGKTADLILVEGNPAEDNAAMNDVRHVILNGAWFGDAP